MRVNKKSVLNKAFTLVEMLIVLVIIGILSATILPRISGVLAKSRDLQRVNGLRQIASALQWYQDTHGHYPLREPTVDEQKLIQESGKIVSWYPNL